MTTYQKKRLAQIARDEFRFVLRTFFAPILMITGATTHAMKDAVKLAEKNVAVDNNAERHS